MGKVLQVNRIYSCFRLHCILILLPVRERWIQKSELDLHIFCCFAFLWQSKNSSKPIKRFSEDFNMFLPVYAVYLAKQHLRRQDLLFIPLWEVLWYSEGTVLCIYCREKCVYVCVREDRLYSSTLSYRFSNSFWLPCLSFSLCDKPIRKQL